MNFLSRFATHHSNLTALAALVLTSQTPSCIERHDHFHQGMDQVQGDNLADQRVSDALWGEAGLDVAHADVNVTDEKTLDNLLPSDADLVDLPGITQDVSVDLPADTCVGDCTGKKCGDDGCSGTCGLCEAGTICEEGICECVPQCEELECGDDKCGGACGTCIDGNPCTSDACEDGECVYALLPMDEMNVEECVCEANEDCADLEDGDVCNGTLYCDTDGDPQVCLVDTETIPDCDDELPCTDDVCNPESGCASLPNDENKCLDDDVCNGVEYCDNSVCKKGEPLDCDDDNLCTNESCDAIGGCIVTDNDENSCDDGDVCNGAETCSQGNCNAGEALECDDSNPCTDDTCNPTDGCVFTNNDGNSCDDDDACNGAETCGEGVCLLGQSLVCDDQNDCTDDSCNPATGCLHTLNQAPCDDDDACTTGDQCNMGKCIPSDELSCDDGNVCFDDACDPATGCVYTLNQAPCDDGNACTTGDQCNMGDCIPTGELVCDDENVCTDDLCDPATGCLHKLNTIPCDDDDACTTGDQCNLGDCIPSGELACDDDNICTDDWCDAAQGCIHSLNKAPCDDSDACTTGEHCNLGECIPSGELSCDDENICTDDACDPATGCLHLLNQAPCDDHANSFCNLGICTCIPDDCDAVQQECGEWDDGCDGIVVCGNCDDGNTCTVDICESGTCSYITECLGLPLINELDYDQPGPDIGEFIEVYNPSNSPVDLTKYKVQLVNGSNGTSYRTYLLAAAGNQLAPEDYLIIGDQGVLDALPEGMLSMIILSEAIQNGSPDGIRIVTVADDTLVDGVHYEGIVEGTGEGDSAGTDAGNGSLSRCPNATDTGDNGADFSVTNPSAGATNICN